MADASDPLRFKPIGISLESAGDAEPPPHKVLKGYKVVQQEQTQWCWAALTKAVADFYGENEWTQCKLVNVERGRTDACNDPVPYQANAPWYVWKALQRVGHYAEKKVPGKPTLEHAKAVIDEDQPLCILIGWKGGGGHFVGLYGYDEGGKLLHIGDPWSGPAIVAYDTFPDTYEHGGNWNWSYWTAPAGKATDEEEAAAAAAGD